MDNEHLVTTDAPLVRENLMGTLARRIETFDACVVQIEDGSPVYDSAIHAGRGPIQNQSEEIVRALFVIHLVHDLGYQPEAVSIEQPIRARVGRGGQRDKYADIVVSRLSSTSSKPYCVIELKSPDAYYLEREAAWEQQLFGLIPFIDPRPPCLAYATWHPDSLGEGIPEVELVDAIEWSTHADWTKAGQPIRSDTIPANYGTPTKHPYVSGSSVKDLRTEIGENELTHLQRHLHNVLWGGGSETDSEVFNLITRLIFAKAYDETQTAPGDEYRFQIREGETVDEAIERITVLYREALVQRLDYSDNVAKARHVRVPGKGTDAQIRFALERIERYHFTALANSTDNPDMLGSFFEYIMRAGFKQSKGQFFTHANIAEFVVQALDLGEWAVARASAGNHPPKILDPAAGSGTFLIHAMNRIHESLERYQEVNANNMSPATQSVIADIVSQTRRNAWAKQSCFGMEINSELGLAAQVNMFVHGDGSSSISTGQGQGDGLLPLSHYQTREINPIDCIQPYQYPVSESFDAIITNPPFAVDFTDEQMEAHKSSLSIAKLTKNSEELFLERWFQFLKPKGRLGAVVPNSLLDSRSNTPGRDFLLEHFWVKAIVSLPSDAFYPHTMTKTSLLIAEKKTHNQLKTAYDRDPIDNLLANGPILFGQSAYLGYRRTAKSETVDPRNDLATILPQLKEHVIWS